jgi:hypothetical protein
MPESPLEPKELWERFWAGDRSAFERLIRSEPYCAMPAKVLSDFPSLEGDLKREALDAARAELAVRIAARDPKFAHLEVSPRGRVAHDAAAAPRGPAPRLLSG